MVTHLFPRFLTSATDYASAEQHWQSQWNQVPSFEREQFGWRQPWFEPQSLKDGNPIFTAVSAQESKAIRIIQYEPTSIQLELDFWLDSFGGRSIDPFAIRELVISCALSVESSRLALGLMSQWTLGAIEYRGLEVDLQSAGSVGSVWGLVSSRPAA